MIAAELIGAERVVAFLELLPPKAMAAIKADVRAWPSSCSAR